MHEKTALEIAKEIASGSLRATEVADHFLSLEDHFGAFLRYTPERARAQAEAVEKKRAEGKPLGKLAGVPIAIKDNINMKGEITSCASKILENHRALFNATVIDALEREGALLIGKTNMDEFAMGSSTETSAFQKTHNPWAPDCVAGGSSGGSAAAVAARLAPLALGTDTGGSIRQPAAFTGTYGFKPTYGRVSRYGLVAFGSSLDQIGPFANSVDDIALAMEVLAHHCPKDSTSLTRGSEPFLDLIDQPIQKKRVGVPWRFIDGLPDQLRDAFEDAIGHFKEMGLEIVEIDLDIMRHGIPVYYVLSTAEASTNLARFDGVQFSRRSSEAKNLDEVYDLSRREGFGTEVKQRIMLGTHVLASGYQDAYYNKARRVRTLLIESINRAFTQCDIIATPTTTTPPFPHGSIVDAAEMHLQDLYTVFANLTGIPGLSMPTALTASGKPIGLQLLGPQLEDARVLRFAKALSKRMPFTEVPCNR